MSSFQVSSTTGTFNSTINRSRQTIGDLQEFTLGVVLPSQAEWLDLQSLITSKFHVHVPLGGTPVVDVVNGSGTGTLVIDGLGTTTAIMTGLERSTYLPNGKAMGTATFLIIGTLL